MNETLAAALLLMFSMGFMGSLHCIGMCGGLVSVVSMASPKFRWGGLLIYQLGRVFTYSVFGLIVGLSGAALASMGGDIVQRMLAALAGILMISFALNLAGWLPDPLRRIGAWAGQRMGLAGLASRVSKYPQLRNWFALGVVNGLLPCGLVYAALSLSLAAGEPSRAMLMMMSFGLGTIPAMMALPALLSRISDLMRSVLMRIAAVLLLLLGLMTVFRSFMHAPEAHAALSGTLSFL